MKLVVDGFSKSITKRDNQIVIKENHKETDYFLAEKLDQIIITGKGSITFDAINLLADYDVDCIFIDWKGNVQYRLSSGDNKNVNLKKEQYFALMDYRSGYLAKSFIKAKIENQKATLGTLAKSRENSNELIEKRDKLMELSSKIDLIKNKPSDKIRGKILGIEGQASINYWGGIKLILPIEFNFSSRTGRYAQDPVNAMLNYAYSILQSEIWKGLDLAGLDPYCGFLHSQRYGRASLVFDLIEEFRQQIADKSVLSMINKKQIKPTDFKKEKDMLLIKDNARKRLISIILKKLSNKIKFNNKNISYSDIILYQSRLIAKFLEKKDDYKGFYLRW